MASPEGRGFYAFAGLNPLQKGGARKSDPKRSAVRGSVFTPGRGKNAGAPQPTGDFRESATGVALILRVPAPLAVKCGRKRRTSSARPSRESRHGRWASPLHVGFGCGLADRMSSILRRRNGLIARSVTGAAPVLSEIVQVDLKACVRG
jgi:hypothetical protein